MKLSLINTHTIAQIATDALEDALKRTTSKAKRQLIQKELDRRKAAGKQRISIEDMLGY